MEKPIRKAPRGCPIAKESNEPPLSSFVSSEKNSLAMNLWRHPSQSPSPAESSQTHSGSPVFVAPKPIRLNPAKLGPCECPPQQSPSTQKPSSGLPNAISSQPIPSDPMTSNPSEVREGEAARLRGGNDSTAIDQFFGWLGVITSCCTCRSTDIVSSSGS